MDLFFTSKHIHTSCNTRVLKWVSYTFMALMNTLTMHYTVFSTRVSIFCILFETILWLRTKDPITPRVFCLNNPLLCFLCFVLAYCFAKACPTPSLGCSGGGFHRTGAVSSPTDNRPEASAFSSALADSGHGRLVCQRRGRIPRPQALTHCLWNEIVSVVLPLCLSDKGRETHMLTGCSF